MNALDRELVGRVAAALKTDESFIEKDWHVIRALAIVAGIEHEGVRVVFSGGTSLAKGWGLLKRFSEDIDFKIDVTAPSKAAEQASRRAYRAKVIEAMTAGGFINGEPMVRNGGLFFRVSFDYGSTFAVAPGLRPGLQLEMTFVGATRPPTPRPLRSLIAEAQRTEAEVKSFLCVDPVETAADKLSALAWRTYIRDRKDTGDDPTIVRHLHDLTALLPEVEKDSGFAELARRTLAIDTRRAKDAAADGLALLKRMLPTITGDPLWRGEYEQFVSEVSYAPEGQEVGFDAAVAACERLIDIVSKA